MCVEAGGPRQQPGFLSEQQVFAEATGKGPRSGLAHFQHVGGDSQNKACLFCCSSLTTGHRSRSSSPQPSPFPCLPSACRLLSVPALPPSLRSLCLSPCP